MGSFKEFGLTLSDQRSSKFAKVFIIVLDNLIPTQFERQSNKSISYIKKIDPMP